MIKLEMNLFGVCLKLDLHIHRVPKNADKHPIKEETPINDTSTSEEYEEFLLDETEIDVLAKKYAEELKEGAIYNIPVASDIPSRHAIQDDVEIITDRFEREVEDIIEGRR